MVFAASQGGVENELESYLDSRTVGSGAGRNFCVPAGYGNNAENGVACRRYENWVTGTEKKLRKNGAKFHYGKKITPVKYLLMRLFLSLGAVLTLGTIGWGYALLAAMGLYYVPELLLL